VKVYGPYWTGKRSKRRLVIVHYDDGTRKTMSYARHLLQLKLGRELAVDEDADHIDGNPANDDLSNLRVLPSSVNRSLGHAPAEMMEFECPNCGTGVRGYAHRIRHNRKQGKAGPFCGRSCAGKYSHTLTRQ